MLNSKLTYTNLAQPTLVRKGCTTSLQSLIMLNIVLVYLYPTNNVRHCTFVRYHKKHLHYSIVKNYSTKQPIKNKKKSFNSNNADKNNEL